jgi:hypothetical protein
VKAQVLATAVALVVASLVAGCAPQGAGNAPAAVTDPNYMLGAGHWDALDLPGQKDIAAMIVGRTDRADLFSVSCRRENKALFIGFSAHETVDAAASERRLTLAYDAGAPMTQYWIDASAPQDDMGFGAFEDTAGFWETIAALRQHHSVDVIVRGAHGELHHSSFTLDGAPAAIDYVLAACGKRQPA